jgi:hypothetical protein
LLRPDGFYKPNPAASPFGSNSRPAHYDLVLNMPSPAMKGYVFISIKTVLLDKYNSKSLERK